MLKSKSKLIKGITVCVCLSGIATSLFAQRLSKVSDDQDTYYTTVGNIRMTITNFGTIGTRNRYWPTQPSCEYPKNSQIEHIYQGGLWIGAFSKSRAQYFVSTGVTDRAGSSGEGYEYTTATGSRMIEKSSLSYTGNYDVAAVSHQDFIAEYSDRRTRVPATGDTILNHYPLGVDVRQESYAWNFPFTDAFVILNYTIVNKGDDTLENVYVGLWNNGVVRNTPYSRPGTTGYFNDGGNGFDSLRRMMYTFEYKPLPGGVPANSYVGIKLLGATPFPAGIDTLGALYKNTFFSAWAFRSSQGTTAYFSPTDDYNSTWYLSRYTRMTQTLPQANIAQLRLAGQNMTTMLSTGPFRVLRPNDTVQVVFAIVCAKKVGSLPENLDLLEQRTKLNEFATWAQQAYDGEDINGNNILDSGEDIVGRDPIRGFLLDPDGKITRYVLPTPPDQPKVRAEFENNEVVIYWDKQAEESIDPFLKTKDFEGYRIYRSKPGMDFQFSGDLLLNLSLVGEFDSTGNEFGYNTGFSQVKLPNAKMFNGDPTEYWYRFPIANSGATHLSGWQYVYGVSAFDKGDPSKQIESFSSAISIVRVVPGTLPTSDPNVKVGVYPNPYYARAYWDGSGERFRKIYFYNLPANCTITIFTIAGDVVAELDHSSQNAGQDIDWFERYGDKSNPAIFSGGEHAWNLISKYDQAISTGLYLFAVKDKDTGNIKRGKFLVIK